MKILKEEIKLKEHETETVLNTRDGLCNGKLH